MPSLQHHCSRTPLLSNNNRSRSRWRPFPLFFDERQRREYLPPSFFDEWRLNGSPSHYPAGPRWPLLCTLRYHWLRRRTFADSTPSRSAFVARKFRLSMSTSTTTTMSSSLLRSNPQRGSTQRGGSFPPFSSSFNCPWQSLRPILGFSSCRLPTSTSSERRLQHPPEGHPFRRPQPRA